MVDKENLAERTARPNKTKETLTQPRNRMSAAVLAKIKKAGGAVPSELELLIAQEMHALEVSGNVLNSSPSCLCTSNAINTWLIHHWE